MRALQLINKYYPEVTKVVDAKRAIRVDVTKEDCSKGNRKAASSCAMAKALEREYDGAVISSSISYLIQGTKAVRYITPTSVSREIVSFDRHSDFAPGRYSLNVPSPTATLEARRTGAAKYTRPKPSKNKDSGYKNHRTAGIRSL